MLKEVEYPQVTEIQIEFWLADPVTQAFLKCLEWKRLDVRDAAGSGELIDSSSADLTHGLLHRALGQQDMCKELQTPRDILEHYEMIEPKEEESDDAA